MKKTIVMTLILMLTSASYLVSFADLAPIPEAYVYSFGLPLIVAGVIVFGFAWFVIRKIRKKNQ